MTGGTGRGGAARGHPARGEIWTVDLEPIRGHEQGGIRPCLIVSSDDFNAGPAGLVTIVPLTTRDRGVPLHIRIDPPEAGLRAVSFVLCEQIRAISKERLSQRWGMVSPATLQSVTVMLRLLLEA